MYKETVIIFLIALLSFLCYMYGLTTGEKYSNYQKFFKENLTEIRCNNEILQGLKVENDQSQNWTNISTLKCIEKK